MKNFAILPSIRIWTRKRVHDIHRSDFQAISVPTLSRFRTVTSQVATSRLGVLSATTTLVTTAASLCQSQGVLVTDALTLALMQDRGLASEDADFDRVAGITRYALA